MCPGPLAFAHGGGGGGCFWHGWEAHGRRRGFLLEPHNDRTVAPSFLGEAFDRAGQFACPHTVALASFDKLVDVCVRFIPI